MKRLSVAIALLALLGVGLYHRAEAQVLPIYQCETVGGWNTVADLNANRYPYNYTCGTAWTYDAGFLVSNGTAWTAPAASTAATATALAATPTQCSTGQYSKGIAASGNANCSALSASDVPSPIAANTTGNAATATALAATPSSCGAGQFAKGVAASGNASCAGIASTDLPGTITSNTTGSAGSAASATLASTATALASTPTQCSAGSFSTGVTAVGNANCSVPPVTPPLVSAPNTRSLSLATAYQATDSTRAAVVTLNLTSSASLTLSGGTTNTATVVIGSTSGVSGGTGTTVGTYSNALTGTLVIGVAINSVATNPITFALPKNWYFAVLQTSGTISISSAFDQAIG